MPAGSNTIKTGAWFARLPDDHIRVGISRGVPCRLDAGYRIYKKLAPGPWFNSVGIDEYYARYRAEILGPLNPRLTAEELISISGGRIPVLLCFETVNGGSWCHRAMAAEWLAEALGHVVPEFGSEHLPQ